MKLQYYTRSIVLMLMVASVLILPSCKRYLDIEPQSFFDEAYTFSTVTTATSAVMGVYGRLTGESAYGSRLSLIYPVDADDFLAFGNTSSGGGDNGAKAIARYNAAPENIQLERPFNQLFSGIESANICIKNIPKMDLYTNGTAADIRSLKRLHGEVLTLRAQFYFELIRVWGDVPAQFEPSADQTDLFKTKTDRDSIYNRILDDLKIAEELVPWRKESGIAIDERITKGAVKAIRAKIALFCGGYSLRRNSGIMERRADYLEYYKIARDECKDIIDSKQHALNPSFEAVFKDNIDAHKIETNGEVIFEVALAGGLNTTDGRLGNSDGPNVGANAGGGGVRVLPTYYYSFDVLDSRMPVTIADYTINPSNNKLGAVLPAAASGKFRRDWISNPVVDLKSTASYYGVNWPIIRYTDVLLMFAEADNEINSGPGTDAISAVNSVRQRAWARGIKTINVVNGGTGYTAIPAVTITGTGTGAAAVASVSGGKVVKITVISAGDNYTAAPVISFTGGNGTLATATATILTNKAEANLTPQQTADKDAFFNAIVNERWFEFGGEGIRKYDLIRWNLLDQKITETRANLTKMLNKQAPYQNLPQVRFYRNTSPTLIWQNSMYEPAPAAALTGYTSVSWIAALSALYVTNVAELYRPNHGELLPLPRAVIDANPKLKQDYGY
ncbi:Starch-binding associating with outer membrane [Pedobacter sp. ok626]|uniref:RagB/SusD family nutrient uptake outer membrane protein n=1 Tax=Pedobacter sp. ok626 TaxID=1761882 RepID=UPI0008873916|nr:RagB/SusD family nutrient uptake outer membrane protein [Pedobacter sp. ok626]SDK19268.1 Starch-binding associating with outer membrane [Pedobacter sp. ok626]